MNMKQTVCLLYLAIMMLPAIAFAGGELLLNEDELLAKTQKEPEYQLLDARSADAQRDAPLAFSTRYQPWMSVKKGLVLVVADTDDAALKIAQSIPAGADRTVYAVKGGAEAWKRFCAREASSSKMPGTFTIPKNTCEPGKAVMELKRDEPASQPKNK